VQTVDLSGGEFDGGELDLTASGNVIVRQEINVSGGGLSGSGGTVFITAGGTATLLGNIDGTAAGSSDEGGGDSADVQIDRPSRRWTRRCCRALARPRHAATAIWIQASSATTATRWRATTARPTGR